MFYFYHDEYLMIPYDGPKTLYNASSYLKPGIRFEIFDGFACGINNKHATDLQQMAQKEFLRAPLLIPDKSACYSKSVISRQCGQEYQLSIFSK